MPLSRQATLALAILFTLLPTLTWAENAGPGQNPAPQCQGGAGASKRSWFSLKRQSSTGDGIMVGRPKVFDNRDLEIMLEDLESQLRGLRAIDLQKVLMALDNLQGYQARSLQTGVELKPQPSPGVKLTEGAGADGALAPTARETTSAEQTPQLPTLGAAPGLAPPVTTFGSSSQDLLTRQVDLQYQITNIQMLLQRSVSDRFYDGGSKDANDQPAGHPGARLMVVVGFQISLTPDFYHRGMAAQVEIEIEPNGENRRRPSLVALMPQQKTYNAASLSKKSNAFGAVAPVSAFTLGASVNSSGETFYLFQDTDTYAFELPWESPNSKKLRFGWQFRPVLGRPSVEPGIRQLFAVIALDEQDVDIQGSKNVPLKVTAKTHWMKYNGKKRLPDGWPRLECVEYGNEDFLVPSAAHLQQSLAPKITTARLESIGGGKALVTIKGENFSHDTSVAIGERVIQPGSSAFVIRSNSQLQFVAPTAELLRSETTLTGGRYGFPALVEEQGAAEHIGFFIKEFGFCQRRKGEFVDLYVILESPAGNGIEPKLPNRSVFIDFGGEIYEVSAERWEPLSPDDVLCPDDPKDVERIEVGQLWASIEVPYKNRETDSQLLAAIPFLGKKYRSSAKTHAAVGVTRIVLLEKGESKKAPMIWGIIGYGLDLAEPLLQVYADKKYTCDLGISRPDPAVKSPHLLYLSGSYDDLQKVKEVTVFAPGYFEPKVFKAPTLPPSKGEPKITNSPTVLKASSAGVVFQGTSLKSIQKVEFEGAPLKHLVKSDEELVVFLTRTVTKEAGPVTLLGYVDDTTFITLDLTVQ